MRDLSSHHANDLCAAYRNGWKAETAGAAGVISFISQTEALAIVDRALLARIIQIDIEQVWSHWAEATEDQVRRAAAPDLLIEQWKELPRFQSYAALFASPDELCQFWPQLANFEASCRDRWGDAIGSPFYQHYFEVPTVGFTKRQRRHLRCEFEHNEDYSQVLFPLRGRNEVGRQRTKDAEPYFFEANPDGNRIVVANRYESEVSREQLIIQLLTPATAVIVNRSQINSIRLSADLVLSPGDKACAAFPFTIDIPGRKLCCY